MATRRRQLIITPHARLWAITVLIIGLMFSFVKPVQEIIYSPMGKAVVYYENEYQRYAIEKLIATDRLEQWPCLWALWIEESNWRPKARNKSSNASGIAQLMPATWINLGIKPTANGFAQVDAGLLYIERRYGKGKGNLCRAYAHHLAKGWY
jgi:hypothetical protein